MQGVEGVLDENLIRKIKNDPVKIGYLMEFDKLTELHNKWIKEMAFSNNDETLLGHRSSYKTTCLSIALVLIILFQPNKNVIFMRKTDTDVTDIIKQVERMLESEEMQCIAYRTYGINIIVNATMFQIDTNLNTSKKGTPQLIGIGTASSVTGKHADIIFTDDIVNTKDRVSRAERERIKLLYMELQNIRNRDGRIFNTGTPWHKEDAISLMPNVKKYDCYSTGLIARDKLEELRQSMSDSLFSANYELKHITDKDAMFKNPQFTSDESLIYNGQAHIDAAYDGADGTAFTIFKQLPDGRIIGFGKRWDRHVDDCLHQIGVYHERFRAGTVGCESNADKGYLKKELVAMGFSVHGYHESMNKFVKISTYLRKNWSQIIWLEETDPEYISEILDYNEFAEHDDSPDSAASLLRYLETKVTYNPVSGGI